MKSTSLRTAISGIAATYPDRSALVTQDTVLSYQDLALLSWHQCPESVAIFCSSLANVLRALIVADGAARTVCALPTSLSATDLAALLEQHDFDAVIYDDTATDLSLFTKHGLVCIDIQELTTPEGVESAPTSLQSAWLIPTSGTTATPKLVSHTLASLAQVAVQTAALRTTPQVWALLYDMTRFAGYQVVLQSLLSGETLAFAGLSSPMEERVAFFADLGVTHMSATPTLWRKILMAPASDALTPEQITLGGEAADQQILSSLAQKYPDARITHIYASTEAGVGLSISDRKAGFPMSFVGKIFNGVEIDIRSNRLFVRSERAARRYVTETPLLDGAGWIDTGDLVRTKEDRFYIIGRESGVLNIGGDKVIPEQIRHVLLGCPLISDAVVYGKKNPFTGTLVAADVVLVSSSGTPQDHTKIRTDIDQYLKARLTDTQRPRVMRFVDELHFNTTGKVVHKV